MKKTFALIAGLILATGLSIASRAPHTAFPYTQPDGSVIWLVNHGDEFHHWTTHNGTLVEMDGRGFYRPASRMVFDSRAAAAKDKRRQANASRIAASSGLQFGEKHFLVFLIEFADLSFTVPNPRDAFEKMLNQPGYSDNGGTGSARDYYMDNSAGQFRPIFDVVGPIKVSKDYTYYGEGRDLHAGEALKEACALVDDSVDFSRYDLDGDGFVDNIFFYYAGYNEAEGGGINTIWPHQGYSAAGKYDGVTTFTYACSSEFKGNRGAQMTGIGLFVHEFAHVLGLPDFYDTSGNIARNPEEFSVMSDGQYLNQSRTPACFNSLERQMMGWMGEFPSLSEAGGYELEAISGHHLPWVLPTDVTGEQFILEMRDGSGWDAYLPKGMVIYHMDASDNICYQDKRAADVWNGTAGAPINDYDNHPCFYVVASLEYGRNKSNSIIFPGIGNVTEFNPVPWSGHRLPTRITDISIVGDRMHFNLTTDVRRMMSGTVKDTEGHPIEGATITMSLPGRSSASGRAIRLSRPVTSDIRYTATTQADGSYEVVLDKGDETSVFSVCAAKSGYIEQAREIPVELYGFGSFILRPAGSPSRAGLMNYDPDSKESLSVMGYGDNPYSLGIMASVFFPADELASYAGMEIRSITFCIDADQYEGLFALIHDDKDKLLEKKVEEPGVNGYYTVDLSEAAFKIPGDKGLYFGYAVEGNAPTPIVLQSRKDVKFGSYYSSFRPDNPNWELLPNYALILSVTLYDPAATQYITLSNMGFSSIDNPRWKEGYAAGDPFAFRLIAAKGKEVESAEWLYDGNKTTAASVMLTAGKHVVVVRVRYRDGSQEELTLELEVR